MNGSIIHHHENSNDKINAGIRVREKHSQYCFACIRNSISSQTSRYLYRVKKNQPNIIRKSKCSRVSKRKVHFTKRSV